MTTSIKELSSAIGEWDYAMRAASHGTKGNRSTLGSAIMNLPTPELELLRPTIQAAIISAVDRTTKQLLDLGIVMDEPHPLKVKASIDDPGSYFYAKDRV